jgi:hypothetical protein
MPPRDAIVPTSPNTPAALPVARPSAERLRCALCFCGSPFSSRLRVAASYVSLPLGAFSLGSGVAVPPPDPPPASLGRAAGVPTGGTACAPGDLRSHLAQLLRIRSSAPEPGQSSALNPPAVGPVTDAIRASRQADPVRRSEQTESPTQRQAAAIHRWRDCHGQVCEAHFASTRGELDEHHALALTALHFVPQSLHCIALRRDA